MAGNLKTFWSVDGYKSNTVTTQDSGNISESRKIYTGVYFLLLNRSHSLWFSDTEVIGIKTCSDTHSGFDFYQIRSIGSSHVIENHRLQGGGGIRV